jgi:hypothetical protein
MLSDLYLLRYNNYYNRQLKVLNSLDDYEPYSLGSVINVNFIPNDGIYAKQVINWNKDIPDYLLVIENGEINSRWFVIESRRNLAGQFELELFRDTLADYYNEIQNAPIFVEKAMLDASNPLIFNQEDMTFNQIRQPPRLLYDNTKCPWIVGYIPADSDLQNKTVSATYNTANNPDIEVENISDWEFAKYLETPGYTNYKLYTGFRYSYDVVESEYSYQRGCSNRYRGVSIDSVDERTDNSWYSKNETPRNGYYNGNSDYTGTYYYTTYKSKAQWDSYDTKIRTDTQYQSYINGYFESNYDFINEVQYNEINDMQGKTILDTTSNTLYRINFKINTVNIETSLAGEQAIISKLNSFISKPNGGNVVNKTFTAVLEGNEVMLSLDQVQTSISVALSNDRYHLEDQPYDMFCIPYGKIYAFELEEGFRTQKIGTSIASNIAKELGTDIIYDVQILPYCPVQYALNDEYNYIDLTKTKYSLIKDQDDKNVSVLIWCRNSNFNFNLELNIPDTNYAIDKKVNSQTEIYRLVSPNYGSAFEFNPYKNGGVNFFRVDCSYKPFNPYIRVAPIFNGLYGYGGQYDSRGLILSGDFSISQLSNAWANYELQNKNYQAIFDRQIQNMEVHNKYQRVNDWVNAIAGTVQGGVTGAMTGGMMGGGQPAGFAIGGAIGTAASASGGAADIYINEKLRNEAIDYTRDQFGYNLGNIQALPTALAKTSTLTINNSLVPMLEIYDCTQAEKNALRAKIEYNGMTVMVIGTMSEFEPGYFKGKLIRLEGINEDSHIVNIIARELNKGVFI